MVWTIPQIWKNGECFILGGGPSIARIFDVPQSIVNAVAQGTAHISEYSSYLQPLHSRHVIGTNMAYQLGAWIDIVAFGDNSFFLKNRIGLSEFPNIKVFCNSPMAVMHKNERIKCLPRHPNKRYGISDRQNQVVWNGNTGAAAISLAVGLGVKRIVLLGFDMKLDNGNQHWHNVYQKNGTVRDLRTLPFHRHMLCFDAIAHDAQRMGVEIINTSMDSAITQFKKVPINEIICNVNHSVCA